MTDFRSLVVDRHDWTGADFVLHKAQIMYRVLPTCTPADQNRAPDPLKLELGIVLPYVGAGT